MEARPPRVGGWRKEKFTQQRVYRRLGHERSDRPSDQQRACTTSRGIFAYFPGL
jgi:hypothetical protein